MGEAHNEHIVPHTWVEIDQFVMIIQRGGMDAVVIKADLKGHNVDGSAVSRMFEPCRIAIHIIELQFVPGSFQ